MQVWRYEGASYVVKSFVENMSLFTISITCMQTAVNAAYQLSYNTFNCSLRTVLVITIVDQNNLSQWQPFLG